MLVGLGLGLSWPQIYGPPDLAVVSALGAGLLLWPILFAPYLEEVHSPRWLVRLFYTLVPISYAASGALGGWFAQLITQRGGLTVFLADELLSVILTAIVVVFSTALISRASHTLTVKRERDLRK